MKSDEGFSTWAGLYATGILLVLFVGAHLVAVHYAGDVMAEGYTFENVSARLRGWFFPFVDLSLLALALVHGLVGMKRFVADVGVCGAKALRLVSVVLIAAGVWGLYYGVLVFRAFVL